MYNPFHTNLMVMKMSEMKKMKKMKRVQRLWKDILGLSVMITLGAVQFEQNYM